MYSFSQPVISPSGITFYTGDKIPGWNGNLLIAGLSAQGIVRLTLDGDKVVDEERIPLKNRIRDVAQGPDGAVYALIDKQDGGILRMTEELHRVWALLEAKGNLTCVLHNEGHEFARWHRQYAYNWLEAPVVHQSQ